MKRLIFISLVSSIIFSSCGNRINKPDIPKQIDGSNKSIIDTSITNSFSYQLEQESLARKRKLCNELGLYDLEKGTYNYELRIWEMPSMWDPSILYILKGKDSIWTLFRYQYYCLRPNLTNSYNNPIIDSARMESVRPQKITWANYVQQLQLESLWYLETESSIKGKSFGVLDGHIYLLELSDKGKYKYLYYSMPEEHQKKDSNHKKFIDFKKRLVEPIIYNKLVNP